MSDLKPCPLCDSEGEIVTTFTTSGELFYGACLQCHTCGPFDVTEDAAAARWNPRPAEDALAARVAELEAEVERLKRENAHLESDNDGLSTDIRRMEGGK